MIIHVAHRNNFLKICIGCIGVPHYATMVVA
jgi:hypothetical protein